MLLLLLLQWRQVSAEFSVCSLFWFCEMSGATLGTRGSLAARFREMSGTAEGRQRAAKI